MGEIAGGGVEDEGGFRGQRARLKRRLGHGRVGGADDYPVVPWHGEEHAPVVGLRNHDGVIAAQEALGQDQVHALRRRDQRPRGRVVEARDVIHKDAGGIDHGARRDRADASRFGIGDLHPGDGARRRFEEARHAGVVQDGGAEVHRRLGEVHGEARVVKLAIVVHDAAAQAVAVEVGDRGQRFLGRDVCGRAEPSLPAMASYTFMPTV